VRIIQKAAFGEPPVTIVFTALILLEVFFAMADLTGWLMQGHYRAAWDDSPRLAGWIIALVFCRLYARTQQKRSSIRNIDLRGER